MKWEYHIEKVTLQDPLQLEMNIEFLNALGKEDWEAAALLNNPDPRDRDDYSDTFVLFKRPISK
jgi:hypothetical protein